MFGKIIESVFGCRHSRYSFPITVRHSSIKTEVPAAAHTGTYVACLDCGKELPYDWRQMKVVTRFSEEAPVHALATREAA
ncbi:MAG TPA: hypothetical protein VIW67_05510 [Terriglobales bacterium]|jgi:hypothetical protein